LSRVFPQIDLREIVVAMVGAGKLAEEIVEDRSRIFNRVIGKV
jgi:hypothetical protein